MLGRVCLYCGENIKCDIFFKCPWAPWWLGAHDGCMVCPVPSFVVQAVSYRVIKHVTSLPVTIHLLSAAGSPVTPNAPPSALTTVFACLRARSIIIGENFRLDLCTITFQFRTLEPSEVVSVKTYCLCRGQYVLTETTSENRSILCIIYIFFANKNGISSVSDWQYRLKFVFSYN